MRHWLRFFVGSPQRFLITLAGLAFIFGLFRPDLIQQAIYNLFNAVLAAVMPFVAPLLTLGIVCVGLGLILRGVWRRK